MFRGLQQEGVCVCLYFVCGQPHAASEHGRNVGEAPSGLFTGAQPQLQPTEKIQGYKIKRAQVTLS